MKKRIKGKLPNKPSDLIRLALADLAKAERTKNFTVDMGTWFDTEKSEGEKPECIVCFAGSVMAGTLGLKPKYTRSRKTPFIDGLWFDSRSPADFDNETKRKLFALNNFREGYIEPGLELMGKKLPRFMADIVEITPYERNRKKWRKDMHALATELEKHGL